MLNKINGLYSTNNSKLPFQARAVLLLHPTYTIYLMKSNVDESSFLYNLKYFNSDNGVF